LENSPDPSDAKRNKSGASMSDLEKFAALKKKVATMQRNADKAQGALDRLQSELEEEFDCKTIEEAEKLLKRLVKDEKAAGKAFSKALAKFEEDWSEDLS